MKKLYFSIFAFYYFIGLSAQVINFPDPNFKATLLRSDTTNLIAKDSYGQSIKIDVNKNGEIEVSEALLVKDLNFGYYEYGVISQIYNLQGIENFSNLEYLTFQFLPKVTSVNLSNLINLKHLSMSQCSITSFDASSLINLQKLWCFENQLTSLDIHGLNNLTEVKCSNNKITALDASNLLNLQRIECDNNQLDSFKFNNCPIFSFLNCNNNNLTKLDLSESNLTWIQCSNNKLESLDLINSKLSYLELKNNLFSSLDLSSLNGYYSLDCSDNPLLKSLNLKNGWLTQVAYNPIGIGNKSYVIFNKCPILEYLCDDDFDLNAMKRVIDQYGYKNCSLNSYCSFKPGGSTYSLEGSSKIDLTKNGCDALDSIYPNLKFTISGVTETSTFISNSNGRYSIPLKVGTYTVSPVIENQNYFSISPSNITVTFPTPNATYNQDFCILPKGFNTDLEVVILPLNTARPGFDSAYKIVYKNKGNTTQSGILNLEFDDDILDLVSVNPAVSSQSTNNFSWIFNDLKPFDSREINISLNLNGPTETPAVNIGRKLKYLAKISSQNVDETLLDNTFTLNQTVVGSYDPNDKTCLEGSVITSGLIGEYVHYMIRFENTGTHSAQNIVVKDIIDLNKFDISTLVQTNSSHSFVTKISEGNKVEFIFENINLPFDDTNNDGYIAFKIKTKPSLKVGDSFTNDANIYFDYNFPILTNKATSIFTKSLSIMDFDFSRYFILYPNPSEQVLNITKNEDIEINSFEIYNILGQLIISVPNGNRISNIDISRLKTGNYFIKVKSDKGSSSMKFIKI
nr:T9SS type A sorting domain-containing protein [uncultured Flavobacterium sp.]